MIAILQHVEQLVRLAKCHQQLNDERAVAETLHDGSLLEELMKKRIALTVDNHTLHRIQMTVRDISDELHRTVRTLPQITNDLKIG